MLGQPISMLIPKVVGFRLSGELPSGATATDLVLTITELLRKHGVVGKFVEFYGEGVAAVPVANRATIGNMSPEFGSTCAIFPIDANTLDYLKLTGRPASSSPWSRRTPRSRASGTTRGARHDAVLRGAQPRPVHRGPVDRRARSARRTGSRWPTPRRPSATPCRTTSPEGQPGQRPGRHVPGLGPGGRGRRYQAVASRSRSRSKTARETSVDHGSVVIAAITSCTNTSNPSVMVGAALLAKNAVEQGPEPQALGEDLAGAGLQGGHGLLRAGRPGALPGQARLQPGRLRLHHLHRQLRPAAARDQRGGERDRPGRGGRAVRQPELRGPDQPGREAELPGLAAAGGRLRAGRDDGHRPEPRAARLRRRGQAGLPGRHLALAGGDRRRRADRGGAGDVHPRLRRRVQGRRQLARAADPGGRHLRLGPGVDLRAPPAVLRRHAGRARAGHRHHRRPGAGHARRLGDHRPHLAGRRDQDRQPGGHLPDRARRASGATSTPTAPAAATTR